jgi:hypothetical protein
VANEEIGAPAFSHGPALLAVTGRMFVMPVAGEGCSNNTAQTRAATNRRGFNIIFPVVARLPAATNPGLTQPHFTTHSKKKK